MTREPIPRRTTRAGARPSDVAEAAHPALREHAHRISNRKPLIFAANSVEWYAGGGRWLRPAQRGTLGGMSDDVARVHPEDRAAWRAWLLGNHAAAASVWLVTWKKAAGKPLLSYDDAVSEALAFGWVDSKGGKIDEERTMLYFARRKRGSAWSGQNKLRIERLRAAGLMHSAGEAVVARAEADGTWTLLDDVEKLTVPPDLAATFNDFPGSRARWDAFPRSARRGILEWIMQAKTPPTRARRILETVSRAAIGERANQRTGPRRA